MSINLIQVLLSHQLKTDYTIQVTKRNLRLQSLMRELLFRRKLKYSVWQIVQFICKQQADIGKMLCGAGRLKFDQKDSP